MMNFYQDKDRDKLRKCLVCNERMRREDIKKHAKEKKHYVFQILDEKENLREEIKKIKEMVEHGTVGDNRRIRERKNL